MINKEMIWREFIPALSYKWLEVVIIMLHKQTLRMLSLSNKYVATKIQFLNLTVSGDTNTCYLLVVETLRISQRLFQFPLGKYCLQGLKTRPLPIMVGMVTFHEWFCSSTLSGVVVAAKYQLLT